MARAADRTSTQATDGTPDPIDGILYAVDWWEREEAEGGVRHGAEPERTDDDEVALHIRGLDGQEGPGSIYMTVDQARRLACALHARAVAEWKTAQVDG